MIYTKVLTALACFGLTCAVVAQVGPIEKKSQSKSEKTCSDVVTMNSLPVTSITVETTNTAITSSCTSSTTLTTSTCTAETTVAPTEITTCQTTEVVIEGVISGETLDDTEYTEYTLPDNTDYHGFKSYEPYDLITAPSTQLYLQREAVTDVNGFRLLDGRYLVAVGTFCNAPCGTYIDLLLENGILIPCIVGDIKSDAHTDETHTYTVATMCASEFIVDDTISLAAWSGNVSTVINEWNSKVKTVRVYHKNYFD